MAMTHANRKKHLIKRLKEATAELEKSFDASTSAAAGMPDCSVEEAAYNAACDIVDAAIATKNDFEADYIACLTGI